MWRGPTVTVRQVDLRALAESATRADAVVVLRFPISATGHPGQRVAEVRGGDMPADQVTSALLAEPERAFHQDPLFAFRLLADIGLRALSPAVNDPATAVQTLDSIEGLLRRLVDSRLDASSVPDAKGRVRVILCLPGWEDFLRVAVDDMCRAATGSPMTLARTLRLLQSLLAQAPPDRRNAVAERLDWAGLGHPPAARTTPRLSWAGTPPEAGGSSGQARVPSDDVITRPAVVGRVLNGPRPASRLDSKASIPVRTRSGLVPADPSRRRVASEGQGMTERPNILLIVTDEERLALPRAVEQGVGGLA